MARPGRAPAITRPGRPRCGPGSSMAQPEPLGGRPLVDRDRQAVVLGVVVEQRLADGDLAEGRAHGISTCGRSRGTPAAARRPVDERPGQPLEVLAAGRPIRTLPNGSMNSDRRVEATVAATGGREDEVHERRRVDRSGRPTVERHARGEVGGDRGEEVAAVERARDARQEQLAVGQLARLDRSPPSTRAAGRSSPLSGPTRMVAARRVGCATGRRAVPTPGSTTARWTPTGR